MLPTASTSAWCNRSYATLSGHATYTRRYFRPVQLKYSPLRGQATSRVFHTFIPLDEDGEGIFPAIVCLRIQIRAHIKNYFYFFFLYLLFGPSGPWDFKVIFNADPNPGRICVLI
jgi:hypothetical protein